MKSEVLNKIESDLSEIIAELAPSAKIEFTLEESEEQQGKQILNINLIGEELGYMIGSKGRHLASLQYILSLYVSKKYLSNSDEIVFLNLDIGGYKEERNHQVEQIALRRADDARILGDPVDLDPMNAAERRVVHSVLSKFDDITTKSFGEGDNRYVQIVPKTESELGVIKSDDETESEEDESE